MDIFNILFLVKFSVNQKCEWCGGGGGGGGENRAIFCREIPIGAVMYFLSIKIKGSQPGVPPISELNVFLMINCC